MTHRFDLSTLWYRTTWRKRTLFLAFCMSLCCAWTKRAHIWCSIRPNTWDCESSDDVGQLCKCLVWATKQTTLPKELYIPTIRKTWLETQLIGFGGDYVNLTYVKQLEKCLKHCIHSTSVNYCSIAIYHHYFNKDLLNV